MKIPRAQKLSLGQRAFVKTFTFLTRLQTGAEIPFSEDYVRTYGIWEFLKWVSESVRVIKELEKRFGKHEAQMLVAIASMWTGCRWCSIGHMFIANLSIYKDLGELGPIDELDMPAMQELTDPETVVELEQRLVGRWQHLGPIAHRLYELRMGQDAPKTSDDALLLRTHLMWEWVIECTIMALDLEPESIPAWSPEGKDKALVERYREARRLQRRALEGE